MQNLFQPYTFNNGVTVKNRLAVAPMTHFASTEDGRLSEEERLFLDGRAENFGLFITAATLVSPEGKAFVGQPHAIGEQDLPSLREVAALIRRDGAKAVLQIHHGGKLSIAALLDGREKLAPSDDEATQSRAFTPAEIEHLIQAFARAAELALLAGFDGVEIHGANNYLIQQFVSGHSNRRTDDWGGTLEKRLRFPLAVVDAVVAIRDKHQRPDFIVGYRFSPEEPETDGITMADTFALIDRLVQKPLQYLHVSLWDFYKKARRGADTHRTRMDLLKERIGGKLPLIGVGSLFTAQDVERALATGWADFIAVGKAVMLNPKFAVLLQQSPEKIETTLDPARPERYRIPSYLWKLCTAGGNWLPPLKDQDWTAVDI